MKEENTNFFRKPSHTLCTGKGNLEKRCSNYNDDDSKAKELSANDNFHICPECFGPVKLITELDFFKIVPAVIVLLLILSGLGYWVYLSIPRIIPIPTPTPTQSETPSPKPTPTSTPEKLPPIEPQNTIKSLDISPDGQTLVAGSEDGKIGVWDTKTGQVRFQLSGHSKPIRAIAMSADGRILVSASEDGTIKAWDLENRNELYSLTGKNSLNKNNYPITALALTANGKILVTGGQQSYIQLWNLNTKEPIESLEIETGVESLAVSKDAQVIVSGNYGGKIKIWNLNNNGRYEARAVDLEDQGAHSVAISSNGEKIVSSSCKNKIRVWNPDTLEEPSLVSENDICLVAISNDAKTVAGLSINKTIKLWDLETRKELYTLSMPLDNSQISKEIRSITFSGDGRTIAASFGQIIQVWRLPGH